MGAALEAAAARGQKAMVEKLIKSDPHITEQGTYCAKALRAAASGGHDALVDILLLTVSKNYHRWALEAAAEAGHTGVIRIVLTKCAKMELNKGLGLAAGGGHASIIELVLQSGADKREMVDQYDKALEGAARNGHVTVVGMLLTACVESIHYQVWDHTGLLEAAVCSGQVAVVDL